MNALVLGGLQPGTDAVLKLRKLKKKSSIILMDVISTNLVVKYKVQKIHFQIQNFNSRLSGHNF